MLNMFLNIFGGRAKEQVGNILGENIIIKIKYMLKKSLKNLGKKIAYITHSNLSFRV